MTASASRRPLGNFETRLSPAREAIRVILVGDLDLATAPVLRQEVDGLLDSGFEHVVLDLRELEFIDSSGLHAIVDLHKRARSDGWQLSIVRGPAHVQRLFELTGTLDRLPFVPTATDGVISRINGGRER